MASYASIFYYTISIFLSAILLFFLRRTSKPHRRLPPSPPSLPLIGHLHLLKTPAHRSLAALSSLHGPALLLRFGVRPVLLISSASLADECFTTHDVAFANRPHLLAGKHLGYNYTTLTWASYTPLWRTLRRLATLQLFSASRVAATSSIRSDEVRHIAHRLYRNHSGKMSKTELKPLLFDLACNVMMRVIAGKRYCGDSTAASQEEARLFREIVEETFKVSGGLNIADLLPFLRWIGIRGHEKEILQLRRMRDDFMQGLLDEHRQKRLAEGEAIKTVVGVMLSLQETDPKFYTDEIAKGMIASLLTAGTDTSAVTIEWAMSLLLNNPRVMKKLRDEIDTYMDSTTAKEARMVDESDFPSLPYLQAVVKETLRLCPPAPLNVPHESSEESVVGGYHVPRGTMLIVNQWAMHRDPKVWEDAEEFKPERFVDGGDLHGCKMMPFGSGRRRCPGEAMALRLVGAAVGVLIQCFEWDRVGGKEVDMREGPGLIMPKAEPLVAMYQPREVMVDVLSRI